MLNGLSKQECSFSKALVASECNFTDAELTKVNLPDVAVLNEKQYQIIKHGEYDGYLIVHERLIGQPLLYAYPKGFLLSNTSVKMTHMKDAVYVYSSQLFRQMV